MKRLVATVIVLAASLSWPSAQERPVPKDSMRLSISGCARGRVFTVDRNPEHELGGLPTIEYGSKIRLQGQKKLLDEIKAQRKIDGRDYRADETVGCRAAGSGPGRRPRPHRAGHADGPRPRV